MVLLALALSIISITPLSNFLPVKLENERILFQIEERRAKKGNLICSFCFYLKRL